MVGGSCAAARATEPGTGPRGFSGLASRGRPAVAGGSRWRPPGRLPTRPRLAPNPCSGARRHGPLPPPLLSPAPGPSTSWAVTPRVVPGCSLAGLSCDGVIPSDTCPEPGAGSALGSQRAPPPGGVPALRMLRLLGGRAGQVSCMIGHAKSKQRREPSRGGPSRHKWGKADGGNANQIKRVRKEAFQARE